MVGVGTKLTSFHYSRKSSECENYIPLKFLKLTLGESDELVFVVIGNLLLSPLKDLCTFGLGDINFVLNIPVSVGRGFGL
jgi:hypothetical protein